MLDYWILGLWSPGMEAAPEKRDKAPLWSRRIARPEPPNYRIWRRFRGQVSDMNDNDKLLATESWRVLRGEAAPVWSQVSWSARTADLQDNADQTRKVSVLKPEEDWAVAALHTCIGCCVPVGCIIVHKTSSAVICLKPRLYQGDNLCH
jgi:hypothetical protein